MVSHGLITGLLFAMAGLVIHNTRERDLSKLGGLVRYMPAIAVIFTIAGLGAMGVPTTSGFIAEFMVFLGSFSSVTVAGIQVYTVVCLLGILLAAGYVLWMLQRVFYGPALEQFKGVKDAGGLDKVYSSIFIAVIFLVGVYPSILTDVIKLGILPIVGLIGG
jgi:NADH-quinone oxidoreductase subunit M